MVAVVLSASLLPANGLAQNVDLLELKEKGDRALALLKKHIAEGKDVSKIVPMLKRVKELGDVHKFNQADALIDRALLLLEDEKRPSSRRKASESRALSKQNSGLTLRNSSGAPNDRTFTKIDIRGENPKNGFFDISVEYGDDGVGWMAYSRVQVPQFVETHLAKSTDHGRNWTYVSTVNPSKKGTFRLNGKLLQGVWRYETPTLVYDRTDRPARRWKLFAHRAFVDPPYDKALKKALLGESWIEYRYARSPEGPWSAPVRILGTHKGNPLTNLNVLHPDLKDIKFYSELGSITHKGVLYLSLDASTTASGLGEWPKRKVILIASRDHGKSWKYVGALTDYADASDFGYFTLTGTSLVREGHKIFLLATPAGAKGLFKKKGHDGLIAFEFENISHAKLKRNGKGRLIVRKRLKPDLNSGGLSDYDEQNYNGGIIFCQIDLSSKTRSAEFFKLFNTGEGIRK